MSDNTYFHFGYYLECSGPRKVPGGTTRTAGLECPNPSCAKTYSEGSNAMFCPACGTRLVLGKETVTVDFNYLQNDPVEVAELLNLDEDNELFGIEDEFYSFNNDNPDSLTYLGIDDSDIFSISANDDSEDTEMEVPHILPKAQVEEKLRADIEILKKYLYESVEVKFGTVIYYA